MCQSTALSLERRLLVFEISVLLRYNVYPSKWGFSARRKFLPVIKIALF